MHARTPHSARSAPVMRACSLCQLWLSVVTRLHSPLDPSSHALAATSAQLRWVEMLPLHRHHAILYAGFSGLHSPPASHELPALGSALYVVACARCSKKWSCVGSCGQRFVIFAHPNPSLTSWSVYVQDDDTSMLGVRGGGC
jgi:hypothetical protein